MVYVPYEHYVETDHDHSSARIRDYPYGMVKEKLGIWPEALTFAATVVNQETGYQTVIIENVGYDSVILEDVIVVGPFLVQTPITDGYELKAKERMNVGIKFHPAIEGESTGALIIKAETSQGYKYILLSGAGTPEAESLSSYVLAQAGEEPLESVTINSGVYIFRADGADFDGATVHLEWRRTDVDAWTPVPGSDRTTNEMLGGIPLPAGRVKAVIENAGEDTSLDVVLML
jgi:hypothetical protein